MRTAFKILFIPLISIGLTAFGMWATVQAGKHPSPIASIGVPQATSLGLNDSHEDEEQC